MTITSFIYNVIIAPIELIIEWTFCFYKSKIGIGGIAGAILAVSLAVNFLALPLYNIADKLQEKERKLQQKLQHQLKRIKQAFKGDERFMMVQALYSENKYHPVYSFRSSLSILIEIPFFIAAYQFLSHSSSLQGASFIFLSNLGTPDELIKIPLWADKILTINILPILMTLINFLSGAIYLKNASTKEKLQLYGLAIIFLIILYSSPSGLVFYWILNNIFSLFKNIVNARVKKPVKFVHKVISLLLLLAGTYLMTKARYNIAKRLLVLALAIAITMLPVIISATKLLYKKFLSKNKSKNTLEKNQPEFSIFFFSFLGLTLLAGFLIPSSIISTSPSEFSFIGNTDSPLNYILSNFAFFIGLFFFWPIIIYKLSNNKIRMILSPAAVILFLTALCNVYIFKYNYGTFSIFFRLDDVKSIKDYSPFYTILPLVTFIFLIFIITLAIRFHYKKIVTSLLVIVCLAEFAMGTIKASETKKEYIRFSNSRISINQTELDLSNSIIKPIYHLSKNKPNVVILFLDKAISSFFPYIIKEFPELEEQFSGFTFYPNTLSYAGSTLKAAPALLGGYEYTPENSNKRNLSLREKHNEALLVMPKLFLDAGFDVTVTDPPASNYSWQGDFSPFQNYPEIHVSEVIGKYKNNYLKLHPELKNSQLDRCIKANLQSFTLLELIPPVFRYTFYYFGHYYRDEIPKILRSVADDRFLDNYSSLYFMDKLTDSQNANSAFIFIDNEAPHEYALLKNKTYEPALNLNENLATCGYYKYKYLPSDEEMSDLAAYHSNSAVILQVAKWLESLKTLGVYDNTRVIILSDHGGALSVSDFRDKEYGEEMAHFNPLFMVKDFNSTGKLKFDNSLMTNADTIFFAKKDLEISKANPFTGEQFEKFIEKDSIRIFPVVESSDINEKSPTYLRNKNFWILQDDKFHTPSFKVKDNIFEESNWEVIIK